MGGGYKDHIAHEPSQLYLFMVCASVPESPSFVSIMIHIPYTGIFSHCQIFAIQTDKHEHKFSQFLIFAVGNLNGNQNPFCNMTFVKI